MSKNTSTQYRAEIDPSFKRELSRKDARPLTMSEARSLFERLMFRPGKWLALASHAASGTRHGGKGAHFAGLCCTDDSVTVASKLQKVIIEHEVRSGRRVGFRVEVKQGPCGLKARVNFLAK